MSAMRVVFRVDASEQIGSGHVMRCLTLAQALRRQGGECAFVCRTHEGHMGHKIAGEGFDVRLLPRDEDAAALPPPTHAGWLGSAWTVDADQTITALQGQRSDWLVLDHYAVDVRWEARLRECCDKLLVIDDLADRPHACDVLLDQNLGRTLADYDPWLPAATTRLIGPRFALLRPEFARMRGESLARRRDATVRRILVSLGGVDRDNVTGRVLDALALIAMPRDVRVVVVMGRLAPGLESVRAQAMRMPYACELLVEVEDMARVMADADLAIGAAGSSSWERCALGLPSVILCLAENQRGIAEALHRSGAAVFVDDPRHAQFGGAVETMLRDVGLVRHLAVTAAALCDANGTDRVVSELTNWRSV